jgi:hypothetical protein
MCKKNCEFHCLVLYQTQARINVYTIRREGSENKSQCVPVFLFCNGNEITFVIALNYFTVAKNNYVMF